MSGCQFFIFWAFKLVSFSACASWSLRACFKNCLTLIFLVYFWMRLQNPNQLTWEGFPEPASADLLALPWPLPPCKSTSSLVIIVIVAILTHNISQTHTFRHLGREQDTWKPISAAANPLLTEANIAFTSFYFHNSSSHIFTGPTGPFFCRLTQHLHNRAMMGCTELRSQLWKFAFE